MGYGIWRHEPPGTDRPVDPTGWVDDPPTNWRGRIAWGAVLPLALLGLGLYAILARRGLLVGRGGWRAIEGTQAIALLGIAMLGAALFRHAQAFWTPAGRCDSLRQIGRGVGALTFAAGLWYVIWLEVFG
jgi:hypothetical protein